MYLALCENAKCKNFQIFFCRKRLASKRKHSEEEEDEFSPEEEIKIRSVVKKVKKEKKEKKRKKEKKKSRKSSGSDKEENSNSTLAQRIAKQRDQKREKLDEDGYLSLDSNRKMKIKSRQDEKDSVLSVIDDVDALLKSSSGVLPPISNDQNGGDPKNDSDVMKELDELINS